MNNCGHTWARLLAIRPGRKVAPSKCWRNIRWSCTASMAAEDFPGRESRTWNTLVNYLASKPLINIEAPHVFPSINWPGFSTIPSFQWFLTINLRTNRCFPNVLNHLQIKHGHDDKVVIQKLEPFLDPVNIFFRTVGEHLPKWCVKQLNLHCPPNVALNAVFKTIPALFRTRENWNQKHIPKTQGHMRIWQPLIAVFQSLQIAESEVSKMALAEINAGDLPS